MSPAGPVRDTAAMIAGMAPVADPERWHFCTITDADLAARADALAIARFAEAEGMSFILPEAALRDLGLPADLAMTRITLSVVSALDGVGLTAAVATALAEAGIPCNMVAAYHHDHAFVPADQAEQALAVLHARASAVSA